MLKSCCLVLVGVVSCYGDLLDETATCSEDGDCVSGGGFALPYFLGELRDLVESRMPPPINALLVALVCVTLYLAVRMRDRTSLPWRLYQYRSKVFIVNQEGGELANLNDVELLRMRLDEIERERDELRAVLDNKRLTEKRSVVDLVVGENGSRTWEETVNSLQRRPPSACSTRSEYGRVGPASSLHSAFGSDTTAGRRGGRASLSSKDQPCSQIPMPCRNTQVFSSADYARKCRETISKLNDAEKKVAKLTAEVEATKKIREDFEVVVEQRQLMGRKISALSREKKEMAKQVITLQMDIKTVREQFDDVRRQHTALTRQFDQLNNNAKVMAKDKRALARQLLEAKDELVLARAKLDGIHEEKSRLVEAIERMDQTHRASLRSVQGQAPRPSAETVRQASVAAQRAPFRNRSSNDKQKPIARTPNEARRLSQGLIKVTPLKPKAASAVTQNNNAKNVSPKSSVEVIHKLAKSLEDKCQEFVKQKSYVKDFSEAGKPSQSIPNTPIKSTQGAVVIDKQDVPAPKPTASPKSEEKVVAAEDKKEVKKPQLTTKPCKVQSASSKSKKAGRVAKELGTKSSIDITEFARSLQKLERNVEINMRVREETVPRKPETKAVHELYHCNEEARGWESRTRTTTPRETVSDTDTSGLSASRDEYTSESELDMVLGRSARDPRGSTLSICCLDSLCSVCSASDCQLDHKSCSDVNCLATCSSCSLPLEVSQSIESYDDDDDEYAPLTPPPLDDTGESRQGLAAIYGNGPVGEGGPWNLPGLSGIMTRTTRPTGSVLACQGSLGEVTDVTSSNELVDLESGDAPPPVEAAKKRISCFTANEDVSKRAVASSPAFRQFLQELSTLVEGTEPTVGPVMTAPNVTGHEVLAAEKPLTVDDFHLGLSDIDSHKPLTVDDFDAGLSNNDSQKPVKAADFDAGLSDNDSQKPVKAADIDARLSDNDSQDVFEDSEDGLDMSFSDTSTATQYFVNNEKEPIF